MNEDKYVVHADRKNEERNDLDDDKRRGHTQVAEETNTRWHGEEDN